MLTIYFPGKYYSHAGSGLAGCTRAASKLQTPIANAHLEQQAALLLQHAHVRAHQASLSNRKASTQVGCEVIPAICTPQHIASAELKQADNSTEPGGTACCTDPVQRKRHASAPSPAWNLPTGAVSQRHDQQAPHPLAPSLSRERGTALLPRPGRPSFRKKGGWVNNPDGCALFASMSGRALATASKQASRTSRNVCMLLGRELLGNKVSDVTRLCSPNAKGVSHVFQRQQRVPDLQYAVNDHPTLSSHSLTPRGPI